MANLLKLAAAPDLLSGLTWTGCGFTASDFNSLASGSSVVATTAIDNSSDLDACIDVSFILTVGGTTTALSVASCYLLPLNRDGSTYGDGLSAGANAGVLPAIGYQVGQIGVKAGVTSSNTIVGTFRRIWVPPGSFKLAFGSGLAVALHSSAAATIEARAHTFNFNG